jgi:hypothetical protein
VFPEDRLEAIARTVKKLDRLKSVSPLTRLLVL